MKIKFAFVTDEFLFFAEFSLLVFYRQIILLRVVELGNYFLYINIELSNE